MKRWFAGLCSFLLVTSSGLALAAEWVEAVPVQNGHSIFIEKTSLNLDNDTVNYWKKMTLDEQTKPAKLKEWEKKQHVSVSEYKVHVTENCKTGALAFQTPILMNKGGDVITSDPTETLALFPLPSHVIPDTPGEALHKFVCTPSTSPVVATQALPTDPKTIFENGDDPLWNRPSYQKKVAAVGQKILKANNIDRPIGFVIVSEEQPNANASDLTGKIQVHSATLKYIDNDDELAGLLGHEIAHILEKHSLKRANTSSIWSGITAALLTLSIPSTGNIFADTWNRQVTLETSEMIGDGAGQVNSQKRETAADIIGLDLMVKAGYNPNAIIALSLKMSGDSNLPGYQRSHPNTSERIAMIKKLIAAKYPQFVQEDPKPASNLVEAPKQATPPSLLKDEDVEALKRIQAEGKAVESSVSPSAFGTSY